MAGLPAAWGSVGRGSVVASWVAFAVYLVTPTALLLRLDGIPLNTRGEFVALLGLGVVLLVAVTAWVLRLAEATGPPGPVERAVLVGVTALLLAMSGLKLAFPRDDALRLCLRSPEVPVTGCLWSPEDRAAPALTRHEDRLWFDEAAGRSWRLGYVNSVIQFNLYGEPPDEPTARRQEFRRARAHPFEASFTLSPRLAGLLGDRFADEHGRVHLSGRVRGRLVVDSAGGTVHFASIPDRLAELQAFELAVPRAALAGLRFTYRNYDCPGAALESCTEEMTFRTLPHEQAAIEVRVTSSGSPGTVPLGYGHLLWHGRDLTAALAWWAEALALSLFAGVALLGPIVQASTRRLSALASLGARDGLVAGAAALAVSTAVYGVVEPRLASSQVYATLFDSGVSFWLTVPGMVLVLLAATRPRWRGHLGRDAMGHGSRSGLALWLLPFCGYALLQTIARAPATDQATPWWPGDDNLAGASRGRDVLQEGTLSRDFASIAKSAFPYLRAAGYLVLGEGERFTSIAVGIAFLLVYAVVTYCVFRTCLTITGRGNTVARASAIVLYLAVALWLANAYLGYGAVFSANLFTEGPAWVAFMLSAAFLLRASVTRLDGRLVAGVSVLLAISVLCRSTLVGYVPLFLAALLATEGIDRRGVRVVLAGVLVPLALTIAIIVVHATIIHAWDDVVWYLSVNSTIRPGASMKSVFSEPLHRLVPTRQAGFQLLLTAGLYLATLVRERLRRGRWTAPSVLRLIGLGGALLLFGFVVQVPLLPAPYYPRMIIQTYFFLLAFLPAWVDRLTR